MNPTLVLIITFVGGTLGVMAITSVILDLFLRREKRIKDRLAEEFHAANEASSQKTPLFKDLREVASESAQTRITLLIRLRDIIDQSGLAISPNTLLKAAGGTACLCGAIAVILSRELLMGAGGLVVGLAIPFVYVQFRRNKRIETLRRQLPEAFEMMSRAIRSGQTINSAFQVVVDDFEDPIAEEFLLCHEQQKLGLPQEVALRDLARRSGIMELQMFAVTMLIQRQSGGNPVEMLNNLASVIRKRLQLLNKVKALTGEGRMQAMVLLVMPPLIFVALFFLNRDYIQVLMDHPMIFVGIFISEALGALWIRKIINFEY